MTWTFGPRDLTRLKKTVFVLLYVLFTILKIIQKLQPKFNGKQKLLSK